ncbi:MAG: F0F1 ATP synthase subunit B [Clostridia bacterium]|nr:F0F1 ATP synthase subunit B [Clostridia bacterium]
MQPLILLTAQVQNPSVISVNIWQIVVSLLNLVIIFLIIKKFLFKPIERAMQNRKDAIDEKNAQADKAIADANSAREEYESSLKGAKAEADKIIEDATAQANRRKEKITAEARAEADEIIRGAKTNAELEKKKAKSEIKEQIVDVSTDLAEKIIGREINADDHHKLIDDVISGIDEE